MRAFAKFGLAILLATASPLLASCASDSKTQVVAQTGTARMTLTTVGASGVRYRLRHGVFSITGPSTTSIRSDDHLTATSIAVDLKAGQYSIALASGWFLERSLSDGTFESVDATLVSSNPQPFEILARQTTNVRFRFKVAGGVIEFGGMLSIGIDVEEPDAGLPPCAAGDASPSNPGTGFRADIFSQGNRLDEPSAMVFGSDGKLYVFNSHSDANGPVVGEILAITANGSQSVYFTHDLLMGSGGLAFGSPGDAGQLGPLFMVVEDGNDVGTKPYDYILRFARGDAAPQVFNTFDEPSRILRGPGGGFGTDFYYISRSGYQTGAPNPVRLFRMNEGGVRSVFTMTAAGTGGAEIMGPNALAWGRGGDVLYVGTFANPEFTPTSVDALYRVTPDGKAVLVLPNFAVSALAVSPPPPGPYGDYVYAARSDRLERIDAAGNVTPVLNGFAAITDLVFGPDGMLYAADYATGRIWKILACTN